MSLPLRLSTCSARRYSLYMEAEGKNIVLRIAAKRRAMQMQWE